MSFKPSYRHKFEDVKEAIIEAEVAKMRADVSVKLLDAYRRSADTQWNVPGIAKLRTEIPREEIARKQREELERLKREADERAKRNAGPAAAPAVNR
jgi:hypothetical protein